MKSSTGVKRRNVVWEGDSKKNIVQSTGRNVYVSFVLTSRNKYLTSRSLQKAKFSHFSERYY